MTRKLLVNAHNLLMINGAKASKIARFALGVLLLSSANLHASPQTEFNFFDDCNIDDSNVTFGALVSFIYRILKGGFGALVMIVSGVAAILSAAFGQYRAALSALVVALGVFVLQIFVGAFFDPEIFNECN